MSGDRIYNFAGYFNFASGIEMFIIFDPDSDSDPDDRFNMNAVTFIGSAGAIDLEKIPV